MRIELLSVLLVTSLSTFCSQYDLTKEQRDTAFKDSIERQIRETWEEASKNINRIPSSTQVKKLIRLYTRLNTSGALTPEELAANQHKLSHLQDKLESNPVLEPPLQEDVVHDDNLLLIVPTAFNYASRSHCNTPRGHKGGSSTCSSLVAEVKSEIETN